MKPILVAITLRKQLKPPFTQSFQIIKKQKECADKYEKERVDKYD
jgi:hypothetical protein